VVEAREAVVLALGGPGTGKTTTALWAARAELERPETAPWQRVLFLTFSRTAVGQIGRRAPAVFSGQHNRIEIATFHAFAYRLIAAFGRYGGHGTVVPRVQSEAEVKLLARREGHLTYDDLLPHARALLQSQRLRSLVTRRFPLIICDEFQDTSDQQWSLLQQLGATARLLLLADSNQMIYTFIAGVSVERLEEARALARREVHLEPVSHRDPSGVIPAMGEAVRVRCFDHEAVQTAVEAGRLRVIASVPDEDLVDVVGREITLARTAGLASIGVFAHSNDGVAALSAALADARLDHVLIGIPESHAEALKTMAVLCCFAVGAATRDQADAQFATFLTASTRGAGPPELAVNLVRGLPIDPGLARLFDQVYADLASAGQRTMEDVVTLATAAWPRLRVRRGMRPWGRAAPVFLGMARPFLREGATTDAAARLEAAVERRRPRTLLDFDTVYPGPVQLMNFHQTKGREADAVLLVYRDGDWWGREREPFGRSSRVLLVSITRARERVVVILPPRPHALVAPFARWAQ
jgi:DNA helicase-2/ATP-dependent DNA helicase PcrA